MRTREVTQRHIIKKKIYLQSKYATEFQSLGQATRINKYIDV